jgi:omega-3 fatty acid desaturase (delta-15 desaturase)
VTISRRSTKVHAIAAPVAPPAVPEPKEDVYAPPPFTLADIRAAVPEHCWKRDTVRSFAYLARDVAVVIGLAAAAAAINSWYVWPLYWAAQGLMFWALFVVGHDCGHRSFSPNNTINDVVGSIVHSAILVPYHAWRISHRTHHANHGHVENDESWHPTTQSLYEKMDPTERMGRLSLPFAMMAYPFYLFSRSPGKQGSHYDPECDLFNASEKGFVLTSNACNIAMLAVLAGATYQLGPLMMFNLYFVPYWLYVGWLSAVTYLHHHGQDEQHAEMPWFRGEEWSYLRGGLTTLDRDFGGLVNKLHHNIETHVLHHLFPQMPHYNLVEATAAVKHVLGDYYREPTKSTNGTPSHLFSNLFRSFSNDHYVSNEGDMVFYQKGHTAHPVLNVVGLSK